MFVHNFIDVIFFSVGVPTSPTSLTVNNLLLGKSAIVSNRGRRLGPPPGAIPPSRQTSQNDKVESQSKPNSSETISWKEEKSRKSLSRRNSVKWKDIKKDKDLKEKGKHRKASIDLEEAGDGIIVSEHEANEIVASMRSRSSSETSSYSSHSASSTDTSLCDENERASDSESELPNDDKVRKTSFKDTKLMPSPMFKDSKVARSSVLKETVISQSSDHLSETKTATKTVTNISDYLDSAAGEPLRTYIDGFETKLKDSLTVSSEMLTSSPLKELSPYSPRPSAESEILQRISRPQYEENSKSSTSISRPTNLATAKEFTELSPIELSPCGYNVNSKSPYDYDFLSNFKKSVASKPDIISRPPDIIDSLTMYPNFVPDIDLTEKHLSDIESPPQSPGAESITVSEDERPIPLTIDKYFEHSPEFFGARVTNLEIPSRRAAKRNARFPKKPDSLTLQSSYNEKLIKDEIERASSLPQSHSFTNISSPDIKERFKNELVTPVKYVGTDIKQDSVSITDTLETPEKITENQDTMSPKGYILQSGRKNSERALQIIQENSKILSRILTKQNISETSISNKIQTMTDTTLEMDKRSNAFFISRKSGTPEKLQENKIPESPILKESTSDSLIGYRKGNPTEEIIMKSDFVRVRPISIDDPFCLEARNTISKDEKFNTQNVKTGTELCLGNKTDLYGWENKGFLAKCEYKSALEKLDTNYEFDYRRKTYELSGQDEATNELKPIISSDWTRRSFSGESKASVTLPSSDPKDTTATYDRKCTSDDYNYPLSSKYNDYVISKASDICSKTVDQGPKICENLSKTENSQVSDFAHVVTSSISFTYEPSAEDDSPIGAKSNSSDTLCQIASLDQVSTPISPKIFFKETPTHPKDFTEKSDRTKQESDDTCSAITSLIETDTLSSLSYPRSPSTGSYHPFPTRPSMRMPKELGVRLGMYPKDVISSPPK